MNIPQSIQENVLEFLGYSRDYKFEPRKVDDELVASLNKKNSTSLSKDTVELGMEVLHKLDKSKLFLKQM